MVVFSVTGLILKINGTQFYVPLIAYPEGTWITGSAILYNQYEITKWCPLEEIAEYLNKISNKEDL